MLEEPPHRVLREINVINARVSFQGVQFQAAI